MFSLLLLILVLYLIFKNNKNEPNGPNITDSEVKAYDKGWVNFIKSYRLIVKTKSEKALLERMLLDLNKQGYKDYDELPAISNKLNINSTQFVANIAQVPIHQPVEKTKAQVQLDNASLLLYFGAFLLVASAGLFVAFGGLNGTLRTFVVLLVAFVLYGGGIWIYDNRPRFKQAGTAFVGIGMAIAPLIGLAAFTYIFDKQNGATVWLGTSALCLGMYYHALIKLRNPLLNYLLIFTFVSLFEASIAVVNVPLYFFGWGLAIIGLSLSIIARKKNLAEDFRESSNVSGMLLLPISLVGSIALVGKHGIIQLGISLLLSAIYYAIQATDTVNDEQSENAVVSHVSGLAAVAIIYYGITKSFAETAVVLTVLNILQSALTIIIKAKEKLVFNFSSVLILSAAFAVALSWQSKRQFIIQVVIFIAVSIFVSYKQKRPDAYLLSVIGLTALPLVFAKYFSNPVLPNDQTVVLLLLATLVQFGTLLMGNKMFKYVMDGTAQYAYLSISIFTIMCSLFAGMPWLTLGISLAISVTYILQEKINKGNDWGIVAGLVACAPLIWGNSSKTVLLIAVVAALLINIYISLQNRSEANRWFSAGLWLLLPLAIGQKFDLDLHFYPWAYLVAMAGLVFSRAIARGVVFVSNKIPLASYAKNTSLSYVYGYWLAAAMSVLLSLGYDNSRVHTTAILAILGIVVILISNKIEKSPTLLTIPPILMQGVLLSAIRPVGNGALSTYLALSTSLALFSYFTINNEQDKFKSKTLAVRLGALASLWITPLSFLFIGKSLLVMPIGLLVGSLVYSYHLRFEDQTLKELTYSGIAATALWILNIAGVTEVQAYVHVFIIMFAIFAYLRYLKNQTEQCDQYIYAMLIFATLPLALQALNAQSGGLYGWWLLLEQVGFIVIGMSISKKIVTTWGLYAAVGAVLFQLRGLGWAALSVLAIFLIGLAVYKIQKNVDK
ncbi:MAG: hypothetical protein WCJ60_04765 [bacterium]